MSCWYCSPSGQAGAEALLLFSLAALLSLLNAQLSTSENMLFLISELERLMALSNEIKNPSKWPSCWGTDANPGQLGRGELSGARPWEGGPFRLWLAGVRGGFWVARGAPGDWCACCTSPTSVAKSHHVRKAVSACAVDPAWTQHLGVRGFNHHNSVNEDPPFHFWPL